MNSIYNPERQYRCTIIRGKSISKMDDLLPVYAEILNEICPISTLDFANKFDKIFSKYVQDNDKTIKNHRTENSGKILGMYFVKNQIIYVSERTNQFLKDNDQPAFFKSVCFNFQQPNGSQKIQTIREKCKNNICIKPYHFILSLLQIANNEKVLLTKHELAYYALNSLDVLQGKVEPIKVYNKIISDRNKNQSKKIEMKGRAYSYLMQHINEQFDYLELANLIRKDSSNVWLNTKEHSSLKIFIDNLNSPLRFDIYKYDLQDQKIGNIIINNWQEYFGSLQENERETFHTEIQSLDDNYTKETVSAIEIGDEGELFVLNTEKEIVKSFNPRLVNKVNHHGKTKGLGYDITSIEAKRNVENPEFLRYIEVKSTKRVHPPDLSTTFDTINFTRNEWVAAQQHRIHFYIYRVYFTTKGTFLKIINNPYQQNIEGNLFVTPLMYRVEFNEKAINESHEVVYNV